MRKKILFLSLLITAAISSAVYASVTIDAMGIRKKTGGGSSASPGDVIEVRVEYTFDGGDDTDIDQIRRNNTTTSFDEVRVIGDETAGDDTGTNAAQRITASISNKSFTSTVATFEFTLPASLVPGTSPYAQIGLIVLGDGGGSSGNTTSSWDAKDGTQTYSDVSSAGNAPSGYYVHLSVVADVTQAPTFVTPAASSSDNTTLAYNLTIPETATTNTIKLIFTRTGGTADSNSPHTVIYSNTTAQSYSGALDATQSSPFFSVQSGSLNQSSSHTAGLVNGSIYTVQLSYQDAAGNPAATVDHTSFTYDITTSAPTGVTPASGAGVSNNFSVGFSLPENATGGTIKVTLTRTSGTTDAGSPHALTISGITSSGAKTLSLSTSALGSSTITGGSVTLSGGSSLASGSIYSIAVEYQDALGNSAATTTNTNVTFSGSNATVNITGTSNNNTIVDVNTMVYTLTLATTSGSATLNSVTFNTSGTASASDFASIRLVNDSNSNSSYDDLTDTQLSTASYGSTIVFSGLSLSITTSTTTLFLTARRSGTYSPSDIAHFSVDDQSNFSFTGGNAAGSFPLTSGDNNLPVELTFFEAKPVFNVKAGTFGIKLDWTTESEINNDHFVIERSEFGKNNWTKLPQIIFSQNGGNSASAQNYTFEDNYNLAFNTSYQYKIFDVDFDGNTNENNLIATAVTISASQLRPDSFVLEEAFPNPFNPSTNINFSLPVESKVSLKIFNTLGQEVKTLVANEVLPAKYYSFKWNGTDNNANLVSSGTYFVRFEAGSAKEIKKLTFLK
ncbi:T9SS type A sorting domain-containing protein [bacterium]|nr:T9SS type A sorting domain-containing protein [bacterium]